MKNISKSKLNKRNLVFGLLLILIASLFTIGYTYAYFTDGSSTWENIFTAGTVIVKAGNIDGELIVKDTSGECKDVELEITNTGSKYSYVRALLEGGWSFAYHSNTANVKATYNINGQESELNASDSANYIDGTYRGDFESSYTKPEGLSWFTSYDETNPLLVEPTLPGTASTVSSTVETSNNSILTGSGQNTSNGPPTVDGLFYAKKDPDGNIDPNGISDSERYQLYATGTLGSKMYTYIDDTNEVLYVAVVTSHNVNDNVFDEPLTGNNITPYMQSAGWSGGGNVRPLFHLINSEYMGFKLEAGNCEVWEWKQGYAHYDGSKWVSDHLTNAGSYQNNQPPIIDSASSITWNLNNTKIYNVDTNQKEMLEANVPNPGASIWKSPFNSNDPNEVDQVIGYPNFSYFNESYLSNWLPDNKNAAGWEWSMVYEFSIDLSGCGTDQISIQNTQVHHSPSKTGDTDEYFFPGLSFIKKVSVDNGANYLDAKSMPYPVLPEGNKPYFKFIVENTGDLELDLKSVNDDVFGTIYSPNVHGSKIIEPGDKIELYYPYNNNDPFTPGTWDESEWEDYLNNDLNIYSGTVSVDFCDNGNANNGWSYDDGYYYFTEPLSPHEPGNSVTLCVKVCPEWPNGFDNAFKEFVFINIIAYVEAVQASNNAVYELWFDGDLSPGVSFTPKP